MATFLGFALVIVSGVVKPNIPTLPIAVSIIIDASKIGSPLSLSRILADRKGKFAFSFS